MKQASRIWNITFNKAVTTWGFEHLPCEWCVYRCQSPTGTIIFSLHVDDIFSAASSPDETASFKALLESQWEIADLGPAKFALRIAISRDTSSHTISLSQTTYIDRLLERFNLTDANPADTPMVAGLQLHRPDKTTPTPPKIEEWRLHTPYRELVGSLNYAAIATRPDIAYAVSRLSSFHDCYMPDHWSAAIHVLRYLKGTRTLSLTLGGDRSPSLLGYSNSDYANCVDTSCSISSYCFSLGLGVISWSSRKQKVVADSSCYAEYVALHNASHETSFLRQLLDGLGFTKSSPTPLHCDNVAATHLTEDHIFHPHVKHIRVKFHHIRDMVSDGELRMNRVRSCDNIADILTKSLGRSNFLRLRTYLSLSDPSLR